MSDELTLSQTNNTKGIAILMMVCLHLFNRPYENLFQPLLFIGEVPLSYYISLFCDCCVVIYCFCSGYGLYANYEKSRTDYAQKNVKRILKLLINYWIVLLMFAVLLGWLLKKEGFPGDFSTFLLNFLGLSNSYNGAWWFLLSYVLLVLFSPLLFRIQNRVPWWMVVILVWLGYSVAYVMRAKVSASYNASLMEWVVIKMALFGMCLMPFILGSLFRKHRIFTLLWGVFPKGRVNDIAGLLGILALIVLHGVFPSMYFAVFTGIAFIILFNGMSWPPLVTRSLAYFSGHSTNIWLVHLFLTFYYFQTEMYIPQNPTLIFIWVIGWCILCSYIINMVYRPANRLLELITKKT